MPVFYKASSGGAVTVHNSGGGAVDGMNVASYPRTLPTGTLVLVSGTLYLVGVALQQGVTYTKVGIQSGGLAIAALTHQIWGIFDDGLGSSGGAARALLAQTSDDGATAFPADAIKALNLTAPFTPTRSGFFYLGALIVAGTMGNMRVTVSGAQLPADPSIYGGPTSDVGLVALPNPAGPITSNASHLYMVAG